MLLLVLVSSFNGNLTQILIKSFVGTFETYTWVDSLSMFFMIFLLPASSCVMPMIMATGIPTIPSLALAEDLCWPKHGICCLLGAPLFMSANTLALFGLLEPWISDDSWTPTVTALFAIYFVILALWILYTGLFFTCLLSWVNKLILKASVEPRLHPFDVANQCLNVYNCLQNGMSTAFYAFFTFSQFVWIFCVFSAISNLIGSGDRAEIQTVCQTVGYLCLSLANILSIVCLTFCLDSCHKSVRGTSKEEEVEDTRPLNGLGFFDIERGTLTSMVSTALTYIIILVQFKMSTI